MACVLCVSQWCHLTRHSLVSFFFASQRAAAGRENREETMEWFAVWGAQCKEGFNCNLLKGINLIHCTRNPWGTVWLSYLCPKSIITNTHLTVCGAKFPPYQPILINSAENAKWDFLSKSPMQGGLLTGLNEKESIFSIDCGIFWERDVAQCAVLPA